MTFEDEHVLQFAARKMFGIDEQGEKSAAAIPEHGGPLVEVGRDVYMNKALGEKLRQGIGPIEGCAEQQDFGGRLGRRGGHEFNVLTGRQTRKGFWRFGGKKTWAW